MSADIGIFSMKNKIAGQITSYLSLQSNWDGYDGQAPTAIAVAQALDFLDLVPDSFLMPKPMLAGSGEVGLYWESSNLFAEVGFLGDSRFSIYIEPSDGEFEEVDGAMLPHDSLPPSLTRALKSLGS